MKKEYIKPIINNIKICNDALLNSASLCDYDKRDPVENIAGEGGEDGPDEDKDGFIWND